MSLRLGPGSVAQILLIDEKKNIENNKNVTIEYLNTIDSLNIKRPNIPDFRFSTTH